MEANKFIFVVLFCYMAVQITLFAPYAEAVISCGQVQGELAPCLGYLQGRGLVPQCCAGVRSVASAARTTADLRTACRCLQQAARSLRGINHRNAAALPGRCRVNIPFKISPNTDCSRIG